MLHLRTKCVYYKNFFVLDDEEYDDDDDDVFAIRPCGKIRITHDTVTFSHEPHQKICCEI